MKKKPNNTKLILFVFGIFSACIIIGGVWWYGNQKKLVRQNWEETLGHITELKRNQIVEWRQDRLNDALVISQWGLLSTFFQDQARLQGETQELVSRLQTILSLDDYANIRLINAKGEDVLNVGEKHPGTIHESTHRLFQEALTKKKAVLGDFYRDQVRQTVRLDLIAPVAIRRNHRDEVAGVIIFNIDTGKFLYPLIQSWLTPSPTAETFLIKPEGDAVVILNELRHTKGTPLALRVPLTEKRHPVARAVEGWQGAMEGIGFRGVEVLAVTRSIPETPWQIVSKIDTEEMYQPLYREARLIITGVVALILMVGAVLGWILAIQRKWHYETLYHLERERQALLSHFEYLVKYANDIILLMDQDGNLIEVNDRAAAAYGYTRETLLQLNIRDIVPEAEVPALYQWSQELLAEQGKIYEGYHRRQDGSIFPVEVSVNLIQVEGRQYVQEIVRDISNRKQTGAELALHTTRLQALVDLHQLASAPREEILDFALEAVCSTLQSEFSFIGLINEDESEMTIHRWSKQVMDECSMANKPIHFPVAKAGRWADCIRLRQAVVVNDYPAPHPGNKGLPEGHAPIRRFLAVPVLDDRRVVAMAAVANKATDYTTDDINALSSLLNKMWEILRHREMAEALQESNEYLNNLINYANAPIIVWDPDFVVTRFNRAFEHLSGYKASEVIGQKLFFLLPEEYQEKFLNQLSYVMRGESWESQEIPILRRDGEIRTVLWNSANIYGSRGDAIIATIAQGQDISKRKQAEEAFHVLVTNAPIGIFILRGLKFVMVNPGFENITGYKAEEILGRDSLSLVVPEYRRMVRQKALKMLKGELDLPIEFPIIIKNGETKWVMEKITSTIYQDQRTALGYFLDISERKNLESQFLQAQKMEAVGRLAGGVAHDFNNMLNVVIGYCELMSRDLSPQDPLVGYLAEIRKAAERAASLTDQLLAFSRKKISVLKFMNLNDHLAGMQTLIERLIGEDIEVLLVLDPALGTVKTDPAHIDQIVMNLVINARDAMPMGGKLTIETANVYLDESYTDSHSYVIPGPYVMLAISDSGQGMDAATRERIFEPFFTTKEMGHGAGLGLSTVYGIVKQSGGHIQVYSEIGAGATFKIYLPQVEEAVSVVPETKPTTLNLHGSETILVVEDEEVLRDLIDRSLKLYGYTVLSARNGGDALLLCENHPARIHILLTDVVMPQMNGRDLAGRLRTLRPDLKVLFMSGYTDNVIVHHGILEPEISFIQKPFRLTELLEKIREILEEENNKS